MEDKKEKKSALSASDTKLMTVAYWRGAIEMVKQVEILIKKNNDNLINTLENIKASFIQMIKKQEE